MPPKKVTIEGARPRRRASKGGYLRVTYDTITSPENASVVRSVAIFGVRIELVPGPFLAQRAYICLLQAAIAFLASPLAEFLLAP